MLFFTNKKWTYEYAIELSTGVVKTFKSFIKKRQILKIILIVINDNIRFLEKLRAVSVL